MNAITTTPETLPAPSVDTQERAQQLSRAAYLPPHLRGKVSKGGQISEHFSDEQIVANCAQLITQADAWNMDPFAVAGESYSVHGRLGFQGKLIAAVVNAFCHDLEGGLQIIHGGQGLDMVAVVFGLTGPITDKIAADLVEYRNTASQDARTSLTFQGVKAIRITVKQAKTDNKMWTEDPEQKLWYSGSTKWARRYAPELLLGCVTDDDIDRTIEAEFIAAKENGTLSDLATKYLGRDEPKADEPTPAPENDASEFIDPEVVAEAAKLPDPEPTPEPEVKKKKYTEAAWRKMVVKKFEACASTKELQSAHNSAVAYARGDGLEMPEYWEAVVGTVYDDRLAVLSKGGG